MIDGMLLGLAYLMAKHALADFFLQTKYQWANKGRYGHPGGLLHAAIHVGPNKVRWRTPAYALGFLILIVMWIKLLLHVATAGLA